MRRDQSRRGSLGVVGAAATGASGGHWLGGCRLRPLLDAARHRPTALARPRRAFRFASLALDHRLRAAQLVGEVGGRAPEFRETLAERLRDFGKTIGTEHDQRHHEYDEQLRHAYAKHDSEQ